MLVPETKKEGPRGPCYYQRRFLLQSKVLNGFLLLLLVTKHAVRRMSRPTPVKPPREEDVARAAQGDRMAKARIAMQKSREKQRNREIEAWDARIIRLYADNAKGSNVPDVDAVHTLPVAPARMISPRGDPTRYVCVVVRPACVVYPGGHCIARMGLGRRG